MTEPETEKPQEESQVNPQPVMNINIIDSDNIVIGSTLHGRDVSIGHSKKPNGLHKKFPAGHFRWTMTILVLAGISISGIIYNIDFRTSPPGSDIQEQSKLANQTDKISNEQTLEQAGKKGNSAIDIKKKENRVALHIQLNVNDSMIDSRLRKFLSDKIEEIILEKGIYTEPYDRKTDFDYNLKCELSLEQKPVNIGMNEKYMSNVISLNLTVTNPSGKSCFNRTFRSNQHFSESKTTNNSAIEQCFSDIKKQVAKEKIENCFRMQQ